MTQPSFYNTMHDAKHRQPPREVLLAKVEAIAAEEELLLRQGTTAAPAIRLQVCTNHHSPVRSPDPTQRSGRRNAA